MAKANNLKKIQIVNMGKQIKKIKDGKVILKLFEEKKDKHEETNINKVG